MPELPEVECLRRELAQRVIGLRISCIQASQIDHASPFLVSPSVLKNALKGTYIKDILRQGKYLGLVFSRKETLWFHLGMSGQILLLMLKKRIRLSHVHLQMHFEGKSFVFIYRDSRRFGRIFLVSAHKDSAPSGFRMLGPEPFQMNARDFAERMLEHKRAAIKTLLLDQRVVAGIGNIYADEALFQARIRPTRAPGNIGKAGLMRLHYCLCTVLKEAIRSGGSSIDTYRHTDGRMGGFQKRHQAYGRYGLACVRCEGKIEKIFLGGRSASFCPKCQL